MKRLLFVVFSIAVLLIGSMGVMGSATAQGANNAASAECKKGGWETMTDADGQPFENQGQCVKEAVQAPESTPEPPQGPTLSIDGGKTGEDGWVTGTGFTPGAKIVYARVVYSNGDDFFKQWGVPDVTVAPDGSFTTYSERPIDGFRMNYWCAPGHASVTVNVIFTVEGSNNVQYTSTFDLDTYCP